MILNQFIADIQNICH
uniref:Uncharacterized protein n=1 Tax=Anguilla anguilla TaxID=7936 RepID=A0A0E9TSJ2_ANGAN